MDHAISRGLLIASLFVLLSALVGLGPAAAQEDDYLVGDVPEWLEDYGYVDDLNTDGAVSQFATEPSEDTSGSQAPGTPEGAGRSDRAQLGLKAPLEAGFLVAVRVLLASATACVAAID